MRVRERERKSERLTVFLFFFVREKARKIEGVMMGCNIERVREEVEGERE